MTLGPQCAWVGVSSQSRAEGLMPAALTSSLVSWPCLGKAEQGDPSGQLFPLSLSTGWREEGVRSKEQGGV